MDARRTIDEIDALLEFEPGLCDLYVEGTTDKKFMDWYLSRKDIRHVTVYSVDSVEVTDDHVRQYSLPTDSNRSRIIALSRELARRAPEGRRVLCVADRDWEDYCPCHCDNAYLTFTDGNSLELYALTPLVLRKFLLVALGGFPMSEDRLMTDLCKALEQLYALRLTNERLKWGMQWIPFCSYLDVADDGICFRKEEYVRAYLQKNKKWGLRVEFAEALRTTQETLLPECTRRVRGHDVSEVLLPLMRRMRKERVFGNPETLEGCLMATIDTADLDPMPLFQRIVAFAG